MGLKNKRIVQILWLLCLFSAFSVTVSCSSLSEQSPSELVGYKQRGQASYYAMKYQGRTTANGEKFNQAAMTAAHKKLPFGTRVKVTNLENKKSVVVRINDRGPFVRGRIIDLSKSAFKRIGDTKKGLLEVKIEVVR